MLFLLDNSIPCPDATLLHGGPNVTWKMEIELNMSDVVVYGELQEV